VVAAVEQADADALERVAGQDAVVERLEEYQRDLEQELADVADLIGRLKKDQPASV